MNTYYILDNGSRPLMVSVDTYTKIANVYNIKHNIGNDYYYNNNNNNTKYYNDNPILTYNYDDIFIGDHENNLENYSGNSLGNSILIGLGANIYVCVGMQITVFKSLAKIINYFSPIGNNCVPYPYCIDESGNAYCMSSNIVAQEYYLDEHNKNSQFCGYNVTMIDEPFRYKDYYYDIVEYVAIRDDNTQKKFYINCNLNTEKGWNNSIMYRNINAYIDSNNNTIKLTKLFYCNLMKHYAKYKKIKHLQTTTIIKRDYNGVYCNIVDKPNRCSITTMFMYINTYLKYNNICIDKYIIKNIIQNYNKYLNNIDVLSQCSHAIEYMENINMELYVYSLSKYGDVIKYIIRHNKTVNIETILMAINNNPRVIKYICKYKLILNMSNNTFHDLCIVAIKKDYNVIKYINNTYISDKSVDHILLMDIWLFSIKVCGDAIYHLKHNTENFITQEICDMAVYNGLTYIKYIPKKFRKHWMHNIIFAHDPSYIRCMPAPTKKQWIYAVDKKTYLFTSMPKKYQTLELCEMCVKDTASLFRWVLDKFKNIEMCIYVCKLDYYTFVGCVPKHIKQHKDFISAFKK
jgi:hypothetical protein